MHLATKNGGKYPGHEGDHREEKFAEHCETKTIKNHRKLKRGEYNRDHGAKTPYRPNITVQPLA
jgi:hypothetical protein